MGLLAYFRKNRAISGYLEVCAPALQARYGIEEHYSPARIMTTLKAMKLSVEHRPYACAMFANAHEFVEWAQRETSAIRFFKPSNDKLRKRYDVLRTEVAEKHNGGSFEFLPRPQDFGSVSPLREPGMSGVEGTGFRWYR